MTIQNLMKRAIKIIRKKQYKVISERMVEVMVNKQKYEVIYKTKPGRTLQTCSCTNEARHCNQPTRCVHKLVAEWILMLCELNKTGGKTNENFRN